MGPLIKIYVDCYRHKDLDQGTLYSRVLSMNHGTANVHLATTSLNNEFKFWGFTFLSEIIIRDNIFNTQNNEIEKKRIVKKIYVKWQPIKGVFFWNKTSLFSMHIA